MCGRADEKYMREIRYRMLNARPLSFSNSAFVCSYFCLYPVNSASRDWIAAIFDASVAKISVFLAEMSLSLICNSSTSVLCTACSDCIYVIGHVSIYVLSLSECFPYYLSLQKFLVQLESTTSTVEDNDFFSLILNVVLRYLPECF